MVFIKVTKKLCPSGLQIESWHYDIAAKLIQKWFKRTSFKRRLINKKKEINLPDKSIQNISNSNSVHRSPRGTATMDEFKSTELFSSTTLDPMLGQYILLYACICLKCVFI
jgi:ABC-type uncharacterized transport system fused permease/ATPase subunit